MTLLTERYSEKIAGSISCLDRVVIMGTLPTACYAKGMTRFLYANKIRLFDYFNFTKPLKDRIHENAKQIAAEAGVEIEFIRKIKSVRKEDCIQEILEERGDHPGLVHVFSAMETCTSYKPWHDKQTHRNFLKPDSGRCLHYYFYFIDEELGLCYLRVPSWCPFRLQFYFNGHNCLASQLDKQAIGYEMMDNAFTHIDDWDKAQQLADSFKSKNLHRCLDHYAAKFCAVEKTFGETYHWSIMQAEYASDVVFHRAQDLEVLYEEILRTRLHAVKSEQIATFLGK